MQLQFCEPYPASKADYHVIEVSGKVLERSARFLPGCVENWRLVDSTREFALATAMARELCVCKGVEVWVVDRNDDDFVALRITPEEYSRPRVPQESSMLV